MDTYRDDLYFNAFNQCTDLVNKNRTINHTDCEHLLYNGETCTKKIFNCYDLENNEFIDIQVCNEWFKLKFNEYLLTKKSCVINSFKIHDLKSLHLNSFIKYEIIDKYINSDFYKYIANKNKLINLDLNIRLCYRPSIYYGITLRQGIELLLQTSTNIYRNLMLEKAIVDGINKFMTLNSYAKYSNIKKQHAKLIKTVDKSSNDFILEFNEFLINLINIK